MAYFQKQRERGILSFSVNSILIITTSPAKLPQQMINVMIICYRQVLQQVRLYA